MEQGHQSVTTCIICNMLLQHLDVKVLPSLDIFQGCRKCRWARREQYIDAHHPETRKNDVYFNALRR